VIFVTTDAAAAAAADRVMLLPHCWQSGRCLGCRANGFCKQAEVTVKKMIIDAMLSAT